MDFQVDGTGARALHMGIFFDVCREPSNPFAVTLAVVYHLPGIVGGIFRVSSS